MKLYLDTCCYNRPYDDQTQERIHLEGEAILAIINKREQNKDEIIGSPVLDFEMEQKYENGYGDYTKEKYQQPNLTVEEIDGILKNR
jgi:hypothetical protein